LLWNASIEACVAPAAAIAASPAESPVIAILFMPLSFQSHANRLHRLQDGRG
jgi:hypothetical protein